MAVFTRTNGDAAGVTQVDAGRAFANATIINTGIAAPLTAYKIAAITGTGAGAANLAAELTVGGAVETIIRAISANATILAYQVDTGATTANCQLSVITERSSWPNIAFMQANLRTVLASNIGAFGPITTTTMDIRSVGIKLAAS
jgi:hypothetical protein